MAFTPLTSLASRFYRQERLLDLVVDGTNAQPLSPVLAVSARVGDRPLFVLVVERDKKLVGLDGAK